MSLDEVLPSPDIKKEVSRLSALLLQYQHEYYVLDSPTVSDLEYDQLFDRLIYLEKIYPSLKMPDSPTCRVGSDLEKDLPEVHHTIPVLSLDKSYSALEIGKWMEKTAQNSGEELSFIVEEKLDGISIVLYYVDGLLSLGVTRGNGIVGNEVTANVKTIGSIPLKLTKPETLAVRGEIFISKKSFAAINETMEIPYANPRNLAAGAIRRLKSSEAAKVPLEVFIYEGYFKDTVYKHTEILQKLKDLGFRLNERVGFFSDTEELDIISSKNSKWICGGLKDVADYLEKAGSKRSSLPYEIDGLVVKVNEIPVRERLGYTGHHPRWAIAFKFDSPEGTTLVKSIDVQVGRTGRITPVARVEPVLIGGSVVSNVTLHNQDYIDLLELSIGDTVSVSKRGDVIPAVERVIEKNEEARPIWKIPPICPSCKGGLSVTGAHHFCRNPDCPEQIKGKISFFIGKGQMDIETFGPETVDYLISAGHIREIPDIYTFDYDSLMGNPGFGEKKIMALREGVAKSRAKPFRIVLPSLGIPELGRKVTELLIDAGYKSIGEILKVVDEGSPEPFIAIKGIGEKTATRLITELRKSSLRNIIYRLKELGLSFSVEKESLFFEQTFNGQTWCVTGSFSAFNPRSIAMEEVKIRGGKTTTQISGATTHLLAGQKGGSKLEKAKALGIKIVSEEEFVKLLKREDG